MARFFGHHSNRDIAGVASIAKTPAANRLDLNKIVVTLKSMAAKTRRETGSAKDFLPAKRTLEAMRKAVRSCKGCDLYKEATQTVFGEGPSQVKVVFVGEQPGDQEDRQGRPFVGPAGRLLDKALAEAGISREQVYVTNAVKHFKFIWRGKRGLDQKPGVRQVRGSRAW